MKLLSTSIICGFASIGNVYLKPSIRDICSGPKFEASLTRNVVSSNIIATAEKKEIVIPPTKTSFPVDSRIRIEGSKSHNKQKNKQKIRYGTDKSGHRSAHPSLGSDYWDNVSTLFGEVVKITDIQKQKNSDIQQKIIENSFKMGSTKSKPLSEINSERKENSLVEGLICDFFKIDDPTPLVKLEKLSPEAFETLFEYLKNEQGNSKININPHEDVMQPNQFMNLWTDKVLEISCHIPDRPERFRRYFAFRRNFNHQYDAKMWKIIRESQPEEAQKFVSDYCWDKPWDLLTHTSKAYLEKIKSKHNHKVPLEVFQSFHFPHAHERMKIIQFKERQIKIPSFIPFFDKHFLHEMFFQGISIAFFLCLDITLELSSPIVRWEALNSTQLEEKFYDMLYIMTSTPMCDFESMETLQVIHQIEKEFESSTFKVIIKRHDQFYKVIQERTKLLLRELSKLNPIKVEKMFPKYKQEGIEHKKIHYDEALAAAILDISLDKVFYVKNDMQAHATKFQRLASHKRTQNSRKVVYWTPGLKYVHRPTFEDYYALLDTKILNYNSDVHEGFYQYPN